MLAARSVARWRRFLIGIGTLLLGTLGVLTLTTVPAAAETVGCSPDSETACVTGTIRTEAGEPAVGVEIEVDGPAGTVDATTGDDGAWAVPVTEAGEYTVTLDEATLPDGETLRLPDQNPRVVTVTLGRNAGALFPLGAPEGGAAEEGSSEAATSEGEDSATPGPQDQEAGGDGGAASESQGVAGNNRVVQLLISGLIFGILLALASVGANLIYGTTGISNFAHGELLTLGGVVAYVAVQWWGIPVVAAIVLSVLVGGATGWLLDAGVFNPLRRRGVGITQQLIVTIGLALALLNLYLTLFGPSPLPILLTSSERIDLGLFSFTSRSAIMALIALLVLALVTVVLRYSRLGRATRAVSDNPALAAATGINVSRIVRGVWTSSAALAALGGAFLGIYMNSTGFRFGSTLLLLVFAAITLGGLGSPLGGIIGALVIGVVVEMSTLVLPNDMRYATALAILVIVLLVRPQGLLGRAQRIG